MSNPRHVHVLAILWVLAGHAGAANREWTLKLPDSWTEIQNTSVAKQLEQLRGLPSTVAADASVYMAPDGKTQLTILQSATKVTSTTTSSIESVNRGVMEGARSQATKHISDDAHFEGPQLVADQIDEFNTLRLHQHRRFALELGGIVHMVLAMCAGTTTNASCEQAIAGLQLTIANQVAPDTSDTSDPGEDRMSYRIGQIVGVVIVLVLIGLWLKTGGHIWRRPKKS